MKAKDVAHMSIIKRMYTIVRPSVRKVKPRAHVKTVEKNNTWSLVLFY